MDIRQKLESTVTRIRLDEIEPTTIAHDMTLQRSIALIGQQVPVIVSEALDASTKKIYYRIHAGQRRISALRELNEEQVLARAYQPDIIELHHNPEYKASFEALMAKVTASENLVRGANAGAEADALWSLLDGALREEVEVGDLRAAVNDISAQTGLGRTQIKTLIELRSNLTKAGLDQLRSGEISVSTAKQLGRLTIAEQTALTDAGKVKLKDIQEQIRLKRSEEQTQMFGDLPDLPTPVDQHQVLIAGIEEVIAHGGLDDLSNQTLLRAIGVLCNVPAAVVNRAVSQ